MAKIYARLVFKGEKALADVPERFRDQVAVFLAEMGWEGE